MKDNYLKLLNTPLEDYVASIKPVRRGRLASEYDDFIGDYTKIKSSLSDRFVPTYYATKTHGENIYNDLITILKEHRCQNLLDLGCGAGELLEHCRQAIPTLEPYGVTIHTGEVREARQMGLTNVLPLDMREAYLYFEDNFFDAVVIHAALQYISENERLKLVNDYHQILKLGGLFIVIDYGGHPESALPPDAKFNGYLSLGNTERFDSSVGRLTLLQKNG